MPCSDGRDFGNTKVEYVDNPELVKTNNYLMGIICAILTELDKDGLTKNIISRAEKNGKINIQEVWNIHKKEDKERLIKMITPLSEHELDVLKELLN